MVVSVFVHVAGAQADARVLRVRVAADACPAPDLLQQQLAPLLPDDTALQIESDASSEASEPQVVVRDFGDDYAVDVAGATRELSDPARDCVERARVAAVFIALNVKPQLPPPAAAQQDEPEEPEPKEPEEPAAEPGSLVFGAQLFGAGAYSGEAEVAAPGGGAGVWLGVRRFRFGLDFAAYTEAELALAASGESEAAAASEGAVALTRIPIVLSAGYMLRAGALALGPAIGVSLDLLRIRGVDMPDPETALRFNPGGLVAADMRLEFSTELAATLRLGFVAFPRSYHLVVDPQGRLGETPRYWLCAGLGLAFRIS